MSDPAPGTRRFLALGDSYTIGEGVDAADGWPARLATALRAEAVDVRDPEIVARTGWTVAELDAGIDAAQPDGPYDLVTLLVGVNDQYRGGTAAAYRPAFRAMLARAVAFAGGRASRVVVLATPDWGVTPFAARSPAGFAARSSAGFAADRDRTAIAAEIDAFNAAAQQEAAAAGARWVDVAPVSRARGARDVASDGLHPSGALYAAWAGLMLPVARAALVE